MHTIANLAKFEEIQSVRLAEVDDGMIVLSQNVVVILPPKAYHLIVLKAPLTLPALAF